MIHTDMRVSSISALSGVREDSLSAVLLCKPALTFNYLAVLSASCWDWLEGGQAVFDELFPSFFFSQSIWAAPSLPHSSPTPHSLLCCRWQTKTVCCFISPRQIHCTIKPPKGLQINDTKVRKSTLWMLSGSLTKQGSWGAASLQQRWQDLHLSWRSLCGFEFKCPLTPNVFIYLCILAINNTRCTGWKARSLFPLWYLLSESLQFPWKSFSEPREETPAGWNIPPVERGQTQGMRGSIQAGSRSPGSTKSKDKAVPRREIPALGRAVRRMEMGSLFIIRNPSWAFH